MTPEQLMRRAIELAQENVRTLRGGPFGAVVAREGEIIAEGTNLVTAINDPTAHAEVVAIRRACEKLGDFQLTGCEIYTSCEPCPMCFGAIYWARPACIYYGATHADAAEAGFDDSFIYQQLRLPPSRRNIPQVRLLESEAVQVFDAWKRAEGKQPY
ncbi:MAG TPA: nucleoside deaminase [Bryobacteraceae bacterium]|nr:nucleoside deaminase [Bryobacteraceae bacterium]